MTYFKHILDEIELAFILGSILLGVSLLLILSVKILSFII